MFKQILYTSKCTIQYIASFYRNQLSFTQLGYILSIDQSYIPEYL